MRSFQTYQSTNSLNSLKTKFLWTPQLLHILKPTKARGQLSIRKRTLKRFARYISQMNKMKKVLIWKTAWTDVLYLLCFNESKSHVKMSQNPTPAILCDWLRDEGWTNRARAWWGDDCGRRKSEKRQEAGHVIVDAWIFTYLADQWGCITALDFAHLEYVGVANLLWHVLILEFR